MTSTQTKVENHIRQLVGKGEHYCCKYSTYKEEDFCDHCLSIGTPLTLSDYLYCLGETVNDTKEEYVMTMDGMLYYFDMPEIGSYIMEFNKDGHPKDPEDWEKLGELLGVK